MTKPKTYPDIRGYRPTLSALMACYGSTIKQNPKAWLHGLQFTDSELSQYPEIAVALGYPVQPQSQPIVIDLSPVLKAA